MQHVSIVVPFYCIQGPRQQMRQFMRVEMCWTVFWTFWCLTMINLAVNASNSIPLWQVWPSSVSLLEFESGTGASMILNYNSLCLFAQILNELNGHDYILVQHITILWHIYIYWDYYITSYYKILHISQHFIQCYMFCYISLWYITLSHITLYWINLDAIFYSMM